MKVDQLELFKTDISWFHIFKELIRSGTWAKMSTNARSLYPVIKAFTNWQDGTAFPSLDTLQEYSGLARASVVKGLKELEEIGLLKKEGRQGVQSNYTLVEKFQVMDTEGRPAASVSFDYLPAYVSDAVAELKNFIAEGVSADGKTLQYIKIDNLVLNIVNGPQINLSDSGASREALMQGLRDVIGKGKQSKPRTKKPE
jgi:hypothetical protein